MFDPVSCTTQSASTELVDAFRGTAKRVLKDLFDLEPESIALSDVTTLSDLSGHAIVGMTGALSPRAWAIGVKEQVYARYGISCEVDEPLIDLLVRLETADHGVRLVRQD
ncbi:hypothetical protein SBBP1_730052 [Burkholderiales bacterium]|nr:hypothetical protein SBBP1_730052 [Burkholderiales bacterium]